MSLAIVAANAQKFEGIATYKTSYSMDMDESLDKSNALNDDLKKQIKAQIMQQMQREYTLKFTKDASVYKQVEKLAAPQPQSGGITIEVSGGSGSLYRNIKDNQYIQETEILQKEFLIKDILKKQDWVLEKETKNIGQYTCFKATYTREVTEQKWNSETKETDAVKKEKTTTVWYTLDIPLPHGPAEFWGLPGLVLEVNDGRQTILCSKIVMNPAQGVTIEVPKKGKKVTQAAFDIIQEKKNKEMTARFKNSKSSGDGVFMEVITN